MMGVGVGGAPNFSLYEVYPLMCGLWIYFIKNA